MRRLQELEECEKALKAATAPCILPCPPPPLHKARPIKRADRSLKHMRFAQGRAATYWRFGQIYHLSTRLYSEKHSSIEPSAVRRVRALRAQTDRRPQSRDAWSLVVLEARAREYHRVAYSALREGDVYY
jgi:hypothetical protein